MKVVIIGAGEVGYNVASRFSYENMEVVVIDIDARALRNVSDTIDVQVLTGSGASPQVLEEAGIQDADMLMAVTNSDEVNLVACLAASLIAPSIKKLARIRNADFDHYHSELREKPPYIDTIINPDIEVVKTIDRLMSVPDAVDVAEFAGGRIKLVGIRLDQNARLSGSRLSDFSSTTGKPVPLVAAIVRREELIIPSGKTRLEAGDLVYFVSQEDNLGYALKEFDKQAEDIRRVMIVGGGRLGLRLARLLEEKDIHTKILEKNPERCEDLADLLDRAVILNGDGADQTLLNEENIEEMDAVVTLTNDDETNILVSLLAREMGVSKTITKVSRPSYFPLMMSIGIEQVVSPRQSAVNTILQHIRRGKVLSAISIRSEKAEVLEAVVPDSSRITGKPLKKISFPRGALVVGIKRGDQVLIPSGESTIEAEDQIIVFATREAVPKIEKILSIKLEFY